MRRSWILILACVWTGSSPAAFERQSEGVRAAAMGGAGVAVPGESWGAFTNPAALAGCAGASVGISLAPAPFGLTELGRSALAGSVGWGRSAVSIVLLRSGFDLYRETTIGAAFGCDAGKGVRWGAACTLNTLSIEGYGSGTCWGCDAGFLWMLAPGVSVGVCAANINSPSVGKSGEDIARTGAAGIAVSGVFPLTVAFDIALDPRFPPELRLGGEYVVAGSVALRAGVSSDPSALCAGLGLNLLTLDVEYAFSRHQELGFTHRFGLRLHFGGA
ncbi:MAG TPA: hypothetical protein VMM80_00220 [Bacteroidota bacterium]|nr:hypothetical protein [Bacteroidota bacterium]